MSTVQVGQVWEDCDKRRAGRRIVVSALTDTQALCTVLATGKQTDVALTRFKPGSTGYRLVEPEQSHTVDEVIGEKTELGQTVTTDDIFEFTKQHPTVTVTTSEDGTIMMTVPDEALAKSDAVNVFRAQRQARIEKAERDRVQPEHRFDRLTLRGIIRTVQREMAGRWGGRAVKQGASA